MKIRPLYLTLILAGVIVVITIYVLQLLPGSLQAKPTASENCGEAAPDDYGIHYKSVEAGASPKVPKEQAIEIAMSNASVPLTSNAKTVVAKYVLFTDDTRGALKRGSDDNPVLEYVDVPAWVVTFCGLAIPPFSGKHEIKKEDSAQVPLSSEWNVIVNAESGEYMEEFSFR